MCDTEDLVPGLEVSAQTRGHVPLIFRAYIWGGAERHVRQGGTQWQTAKAQAG